MESSFFNSSSSPLPNPQFYTDPTSRQTDQFYLQKLATHVQFMEEQFRKNLEQQRKILHQLTRQRYSELRQKEPEQSKRQTTEREMDGMTLSAEETQFVKQLLLGYLADTKVGLQNSTARELMDEAMRTQRSAQPITHNRTMSQPNQYYENCRVSVKQIKQKPTTIINRPWVQKETVQSMESLADSISLNISSSPLDNLCLDCESSIIIDNLPKTSRVKKTKEPTSQLNFRPNIIRKTNAAKSPDTFNKTGAKKSHHSSSSCLSTSRTISIHPYRS